MGGPGLKASQTYPLVFGEALAKAFQRNRLFPNLQFEHKHSAADLERRLQEPHDMWDDAGLASVRNSVGLCVD